IVTDDMPFLTDSVTAELNTGGFAVHLIIHPVMAVKRDAEGRLTEVLPPPATPPEGAIPESIIHAEVERQTEKAELLAIQDHVERVIGEVRAAVEDWSKMRAKALDIAAHLPDRPPASAGPEEITEAGAFLCW